MTAPGTSEAQHSSSTGQALTDSTYLDQHFEAMKPEYEEMIRSVGIEKGWHVLDAGAGGGSFITLLADLVSADGQISALDLAPEDIERINQRASDKEFPCTVRATEGSITEVPYDGDEFDAVWCANVVQYLTDEEFRQTLSEFQRVTKPDGLIAIKEIDITGLYFGPLEPRLWWDLFYDLRKVITQLDGVFRTRNFPKWYRDAGVEIVSYQTYTAERRQPLGKADRAFIDDILPFWGQMALSMDPTREEEIEWKRLLDNHAEDFLANDPDFFIRETHGVIVGRVV